MADADRKKNTQRISASGRARQGGAPASPSLERKAARRSLMLWLSLAVLAVLALSFWLVRGRQSAATSAQQQATPAPFAGVAYPSQGHQGHRPGDLQRYAHFKYSTTPPTSGFHREVFTTGFIASKPIPNFVQVHLLEHGNVLLQYDCICPAIVATLSRIAGEFDSRLIAPGSDTPSLADVQSAEEQGLAVIVAPYPGMKTAVALTAWTRLGTLPDADEGKIVSFINLYLHNTDNLNR